MKDKGIRYFPILVLLLVNLVLAAFSFKDQGISWDEPLFYDYADAIRTAYTPQAFADNFDFNSVYGKSASDHQYYGPAYLLIAQPLAKGLSELLGSNIYQSWHLVNFLTFQVGLLVFYLLLIRWLKPFQAIASTAFLAWQPLFWGHAYNNPKDIPFLVFCLATIYFGFKFVDFPDKSPFKKYWGALLLYGLFLGLTSSVRVIGPIAGGIVFLNLLFQKKFSKIPLFLVAGIFAILVMILSWPYLWTDPVNNLLAVLKHMSNNPTELAVLYNGQIFRANSMPASFIPKMLVITLTEPTWFLVIIGGIALVRWMINKEIEWQSILPFFVLFGLLLSYIILLKPAVYDGFRHFFFITPILFILVGLAFRLITEKLTNRVAFAFTLLLLFPGIFGILQNHPYEYSYYNQFVGGTTGAYRNYETDYWLTCYQPALQWFQEDHPGQPLSIQREIQLARAYGSVTPLLELAPSVDDLPTGSFLLTHSRANLDQRSVFRNIPIVKSFGVGDANFCNIKRVE